MPHVARVVSRNGQDVARRIVAQVDRRAHPHGGDRSATRSSTSSANPRDAARLRRISPLFNADKIKVPLMVLQGANHPRVLKVESDEIVAAAKKNGVPVEYIVFPDKGHGFVKKENEIKGYSAVIEFFDRYLKAARSPSSMSSRCIPVKCNCGGATALRHENRNSSRGATSADALS
jgi:acetyl esterase/lipase